MSKRVGKLKKKAVKRTGGKCNLYCLIILAAIFVAAVMSGVNLTFWQSGYEPEHTTYIYEYETVTVLPEGEWYQLKISFSWEAGVDPNDYSDIVIGFTDMSYVGKGEHLFRYTEDGTWFTFDTPIVLRDASVYVYMSAVGFHTVNDYNLISAGPWSGQIAFMSGAVSPAGYIMYTWVRI